MDVMQTLLDTEATLGNTRAMIVKQIIEIRGTEPPHCYGLDDCSTQALSTCPWRMDCGDKNEN